MQNLQDSVKRTLTLLGILMYWSLRVDSKTVNTNTTRARTREIERIITDATKKNVVALT